MDLPEPVQEHLKLLFVKSRFPAFLFIARDGNLADWGGYCDRYGMDNLNKDKPAGDQVDFIESMLPLNNEWFCLPRILIHDFRVVDAHFIPGDGGDWVVMLDTTEDAEREALVQQQSNDLTLLKQQQEEILTKLNSSNKNLLAVFDQLRLTTALITEDGKVSFISRSGLKTLQADTKNTIGKKWRDVFPFAPEDAEQFQKLLDEPNTPHERLRVKFAPLPQQKECSVGRPRPKSEPQARATQSHSNQRPETSNQQTSRPATKSFDIDVQSAPLNPTLRIAYFYDVSELLDLRSMLHEKSKFQDMIGKSHAMHKVFERIKDVARFEATVLIEGETGTGKELVARAIHYSSSRKDGPFIIVNCAGLADSLINSQLFGHKKGSFTDATSDQKGVFEAANGGTIVLDVIGDIPMNTQTRILRALEQREIIRVGETQARKVDIRILAATNKNLSAEVEKGNFRLDLLYRIKIARVSLPPLHDRKEDIPLLVEAFVNELCLENGINIPHIEREVLSTMMVYSWPGNIRELRNAIEFALINCKESKLRLIDLPPEITAIKTSRSYDTENPDSEKNQLITALNATEGNRDQAAKLLGISRATLYRRIKSYQL